MSASASARGRPHTAGVGCSARMSSITEAGGEDSWPSTRVARCCTLAMATTDGSASSSRYEHHGSSVSCTMSMVTSCSWR